MYLHFSSEWFSKKCKLSDRWEGDEWNEIVGSAEISVLHYPDLCGCWINVTDENGLISKTMIGANTVMKVSSQSSIKFENKIYIIVTLQLENNECSWRAVEWADELFQWRDLKATFETQEDAETFFNCYELALDDAEEFQVIDQVPAVN